MNTFKTIALLLVGTDPQISGTADTAIFLVPDPDPCVLRPQPVTQGRRAIPAAVIDKQQFPVGKALPENTVHTAL